MKTIPVCLIVAGFIVPAVCLAEPPPRPAAEGPRKGPEKREGERAAEFWKKVDKDKDGSLSKEEFNAMPRIENLPMEKQTSLFQRLDKNGDGLIVRDELSWMDGRPPNGDGGGAMLRLWELDLDHSGGLSFSEFQTGKFFNKLPLDRQKALFARLDTDRDGMITPKDRPEPPFKKGGEDGRAKDPDRGDRQEGGKAGGNRMGLQQLLKHLDKDGDGMLSFEEFRAGAGVKDLSEDEQEDRFEKFDKNGDLKLSPEDLPPPPPRGEDRPPGPPKAL